MSDDASFLQRVRESCIALQTEEARVDPAAAEAFAKSLDIDRIKHLGSNLSNLHKQDVVAANTSFSVVFPTAESEVNMIAVAHALDFGYVSNQHTRMLACYEGQNKFLGNVDAMWAFHLFRGDPDSST